MPAPVVIAGTGVALFNAVRAGVMIYDIHRRKELRRKEDVRLERAKLEETMAYQRVKDSRAALVASADRFMGCLLYTSPSPRDQRGSRMPSSA